MIQLILTHDLLRAIHPVLPDSLRLLGNSCSVRPLWAIESPGHLKVYHEETGTRRHPSSCSKFSKGAGWVKEGLSSFFPQARVGDVGDGLSLKDARRFRVAGPHVGKQISLM